MLLKKQSHLHLQQEAKKILRFSTAYNNTFVFVRVDKTGEQESIVHIDQHGNTLMKHTYRDIINMFAQLDQKQVIVLNVPHNRIDIINLHSKTIYPLLHQYLFDDVAQMDIYTFYDTKYFCIVQHGSHSDHRLRLTYYSYLEICEFMKQGVIAGYPLDDRNVQPFEIKPISEFQTDQQWSYDCPIKKSNNHSTITWFKIKQQAQISFYEWNLRQIPEGKLTQIITTNTIGQPYGLDNIEIEIITVWQTRPDVYTLVCNSNKYLHNAINSQGVINNIYIYDHKTNTLRQSKYYFKDEQNNFSWNDQILEYIYVGPISVFRTFLHQPGRSLPSPVYYVDNVTEEIVKQEQWVCTCYNECFVPGFDNSTVVEAEYLNADVKQVIVTTTKLIEQKQLSLHLLLHLNEEFDDDLLKDAIELLHDST